MLIMVMLTMGIPYMLWESLAAIMFDNSDKSFSDKSFGAKKFGE